MEIEIPEKKKLVHNMLIPIRWGDMDAMDHLNNGSYFRYLESIRVDWMYGIAGEDVRQRSRRRHHHLGGFSGPESQDPARLGAPAGRGLKEFSLAPMPGPGHGMRAFAGVVSALFKPP